MEPELETSNIESSPRSPKFKHWEPLFHIICRHECPFPTKKIIHHVFWESGLISIISRGRGDSHLHSISLLWERSMLCISPFYHGIGGPREPACAVPERGACTPVSFAVLRGLGSTIHRLRRTQLRGPFVQSSVVFVGRSVSRML